MTELQHGSNSSELNLTINGQARSLAIAPPSSVASVISALGMNPDRIAVEHNGRIARRTTWAETLVGNGDKLEVVHFVGGGQL